MDGWARLHEFMMGTSLFLITGDVAWYLWICRVNAWTGRVKSICE